MTVSGCGLSTVHGTSYLYTRLCGCEIGISWYNTLKYTKISF